MHTSRYAALLRWTLIGLLLADLAYSFLQHCYAPLDGDMPGVILPTAKYAQVLRDPLGLHALLDGAYYAGTNRFVAHWTMERYYKLAPRALQAAGTTPLDSVYLAGAVAKTVMQAALLFLMSAYASGTTRIVRLRFLAAAVMIAPLFQTFGFVWQIGIIPSSPSFCFGYPAASAWLLLFLLPHALWYAHGRAVGSSRWAVWMSVPLAWTVAFNGPLNAPLLLLICPVVLAFEAWKKWNKPKTPTLVSADRGPRRPRWIVHAAVAGIFFAALSSAVGQYNIENLEYTLPLRQRYALLTPGILNFFFASPAVILFVAALLINLGLVNLLRLSQARRINRAVLCFALFAAVYVALLPLGGYRRYRPVIISNDSIQPLILAGAVLYAFSGVAVLQWLRWKGRLAFAVIPAVLGGYFFYSDQPDRNTNRCERDAIKAIAASADAVVRIDSQCSIMARRPLFKPSESEAAGKLLYYWRIFPEEKTYYQSKISR